MGAKGRNRIIILLFSVLNTAPNRPHSYYHLSVHCTQYNTNDINCTAAVSADTILFVNKILQWIFFFGETFTIKRYDLYRMVKRVVTRTSIKLRVKTKWTYILNLRRSCFFICNDQHIPLYSIFSPPQCHPLFSVLYKFRYSRCIIPIVVLFVTTWL